MKDDIIASVVGCDLCHADGHTVRHPAPVLAMCRHLVEAGYDPKRPLLAFRGTELAMHVKSIGYGAHYANGVSLKDWQQTNRARRAAR